MNKSSIYLKVNNKITQLSNKNYPNPQPPFWDWCLIKEDLISVNIELQGYWENHLALIYQQLIKEGDIVIDAGANIGGHTLNFAYSVGDKGKVIAFEPQPFIFNILTTNILINNLTSRVTQHKLALSDKTKTQQFNSIEFREPYSEEKGHGWHLDRNPISVNYGGREIGDTFDGEEVMTTTIDNLKLKKLNFIKVDIQGAELNALKGGIKTIKKHRPIIFIENYAHKNLPNLTKEIQVVKLLKSWGYIGYRLLQGNEDDCIFVYKDNIKNIKKIIQNCSEFKEI